MAPRLGHEGSGFLSVEDNEALRRVFAYPENCVISYVCGVCVCMCVCESVFRCHINRLHLKCVGR